MKRHLLTLAAAIVAGTLPIAGGAEARDHDGRWERAAGPGERGPRGEAGPWTRGGGRWERGPAPPPDYGPPPGYGPPHPYGMRRGGYLPPEVRGGVVPNPGRYRLRPPPRGYSWVRVGNAFVLMDTSTGQIFDMITD